MVQVLPYVQTPLESLTPHIVNAFGNISQGLEKRNTNTIYEKLFGPIQQTPQENNVSQGPQPGQSHFAYATSKPGGLSPMEALPFINAAEAYAPGVGGKFVGDYLSNQQNIQAKEGLQERRIEGKREEKAEPELLEREQKLNHFEQEAMRFDRLNELFSPDLEKKFPSAFAAALLTNDGELRPTALATLSPEAQESLKLIADNLSGAKDTFGARVTNFDLQSYMKRLPSLLNTADGRRRVLRDLRIMNDLNKRHAEGVLNIVEREGGPGQTSISKAERLYKKENKEYLDEKRQEFINPSKTQFSTLPDAKNYSGRTVIDEETGERFKSNGTQWEPE
jgi:hypothetical protein